MIALILPFAVKKYSTALIYILLHHHQTVADQAKATHRAYKYTSNDGLGGNLKSLLYGKSFAPTRSIYSIRHSRQLVFALCH